MAPSRAMEHACPICGSIGALSRCARGAGKAWRHRSSPCSRCQGVYQRPMLLPEFNPDAEWSAVKRKNLEEEQGCGRGEFLRGAANRG